MAILPTGIGPVTGYNIERSLRFNSADSAYLNRTFGSAGNRKTWTWSGWVKRTLKDNVSMLSQYTDGNNQSLCAIRNNTTGTNPNTIRFYDLASGSFTTDIYWSPIYRDVSAWYHIVLVADTTQSTNTNRIKLYVNGVQVTATISATWPAQNTDLRINVNSSHFIGQNGGGSDYADGYLTEINFVDGSAKTPSDFGETDINTGVWKPKAYSGSYGTNGFYLKFADNSGTTSTTLGKDSSGNGNNWTPNNFSVTAGVGNDSLVDTPTNYGTDTGVGGEVRGNYCTLNPLSTTAGTYTQGNLRYVGAAAYRRSNGTLALSTGKWYWEVTLGNNPYSPRNSGSVYNAFGFGLSTVFNSTTAPISTTDAIILHDSGYYKNFSGSVTDGGSAFVSGDVLSIAVDLDANTFTFYKNNTQLVTGTIGGTAGRELVPIIISDSATYGVMDCNFGQRAFAYTAPSGFKALCTQNLPTPAVVQGDDYFNTVLYTGNATTPRAITGYGFGPQFIVQSRRDTGYGLMYFDIVRGVNKRLTSASTAAEDTYNLVSSFDSDGFTMNVSDQGSNASGGTYVAWGWKAGGTGVSNTSGSISSTVSASTTAGFSVVTYTGTGSNATVGHGLGAVPRMIIIKGRDTAYNWRVYHASLGNTGGIFLNTTAAFTSTSGYWNDTTPTSTVFTIGTDAGMNQSAATYVAYCFAPVAGYSAFGSFTGNGSTDGAFVYLGFRPAFVLMKCSSDGSVDKNWGLFDNDRLGYNSEQRELRPNTTTAEGTDSGLIDFVSNGFKIRSASNGFGGGNGQTYIYAAFAEHPFKHSLAR